MPLRGAFHVVGLWNGLSEMEYNAFFLPAHPTVDSLLQRLRAEHEAGDGGEEFAAALDHQRLGWHKLSAPRG